MCIHVCVCVYMCVYIYMCLCMCIHMCVYIYMCAYVLYIHVCVCVPCMPVTRLVWTLRSALHMWHSPAMQQERPETRSPWLVASPQIVLQQAAEGPPQRLVPRALFPFLSSGRHFAFLGP